MIAVVFSQCDAQSYDWSCPLGRHEKATRVPREANRDGAIKLSQLLWGSPRLALEGLVPDDAVDNAWKPGRIGGGYSKNNVAVCFVNDNRALVPMFVPRRFNECAVVQTNTDEQPPIQIRRPN